MRTTFALYQKYEDAQKVVDKLLDKNFEKGEINIIAQKSAVDSARDINERTINVDVTKEIGEQKVRGLDAMLGRLQPIRTQTAGDLVASGDVAKVLAKTAAAPDAADGSLKGVLMDFGVDETPAKAYAEGIRGGGLLVFVRSADERAAEAKEALSEASAKHITTFSR